MMLHLEFTILLTASVQNFILYLGYTSLWWILISFMCKKPCGSWTYEPGNWEDYIPTPRPSVAWARQGSDHHYCEDLFWLQPQPSSPIPPPLERLMSQCVVSTAHPSIPNSTLYLTMQLMCIACIFAAIDNRKLFKRKAGTFLLYIVSIQRGVSPTSGWV